MQLLRATTKHKEDAALGFVLASFFGIGICLFTMIQNLPGGEQERAGQVYVFGPRRPHSEGAMSSSSAS